MSQETATVGETVIKERRLNMIEAINEALGVKFSHRFYF